MTTETARNLEKVIAAQRRMIAAVKASDTPHARLVAGIYAGYLQTLQAALESERKPHA